MKGGFYGLRGKQISLTLIAFICATIFLWAWDKTALLATVNPPQSLYINPSTESVRRVPFSKLEQFDSNVRDKDDFVDVVGGGEKKGELENENIVDFGAENNLDRTDDFQTKTPQIEKKGSRFSSLEEQKKTKQDIYGETSVEPLEKTLLSGISADSKTKNVLKTGSDENSTVVIEEKKATACNYAKGKWVEDTARPLYSGFECKQWLSEMWACRLTQRTDFAYETFRWLPNDCSMPEFEPSSFLKRMQDKTIAIVGDSLGRQQFQSMMCMVTAGKQRSDVLDVGYEYGLTLSPGATRPSGWAYRFPTTNTTILYYWSASLTDLTPINITNPTTDWAMHLDRPPGFLRDYLYKFDVLVLNTGHHWNRGKLQANRWVMYVGGVPNRDRKIAQIGGAKDFTIYSIVKWLDSELPKHPKLKAFFRTISPRHFFHGDWNSGGSCDNTTPLAGGKEVVKNESSDPVVAKAVEGTRVKLLDITAISELRDEGHISRYSIKATPGVQDCLHWCLPGVPDTWNEILFAQL